MFAVSEISKIGIGFISIFLLKARVLYLTILKRKSLSLPLKVDTDQFVNCLVLPECLPVKIQLHFTLGQWSESWRRWCRVSFSVIFSHFSASFKNSSPREKVGNCLRFGTSGPSLCLYPLLSRNHTLPTLTMAARAKTKISGDAISSRHQRVLSRFGTRLRILNLISWLC